MAAQIEKYKPRVLQKKNIRVERRKKYAVAAVIILAVICLTGYREYIAELIPVGGEATYLTSNSADRISDTMADIVVACDKNGITGINRGGKEKWYIEGQLDKPIMSVAKHNAAVSSAKSKTVYSIQENGKYEMILTDEPVINVKVNETGDIAVIMDKEPYHGGIAVYNDKGEQRFAWWAGSGYLTDAALSEDGKTLAVAVADSANGRLCSNIIYFDITVKDSRETVLTCEGELISALEWKSGRLVVVSDIKTRILSSGGQVKKEIEYEGEVLNRFNISSKGNLIFVTGNSSLDLRQTVTSYSINGRKKGSFVFEGEIDGISTNLSRILIISGKTAVMSNCKGTNRKEFSCDTDIYDGSIFKFGNRVYLDEGNTAKLRFIR